MRSSKENNKESSSLAYLRAEKKIATTRVTRKCIVGHSNVTLPVAKQLNEDKRTMNLNKLFKRKD